MLTKLGDLLNKFEQEHNVYLDVNDAAYFWIVNAKFPPKNKFSSRLNNTHQFISAPYEQGYVLILKNSDNSLAYTVENWGLINTFEDFVKKVLLRILEELAESEQEYPQNGKPILKRKSHYTQ